MNKTMIWTWMRPKYKPKNKIMKSQTNIYLRQNKFYENNKHSSGMHFPIPLTHDYKHNY